MMKQLQHSKSFIMIPRNKMLSVITILVSYYYYIFMHMNILVVVNVTDGFTWQALQHNNQYSNKRSTTISVFRKSNENNNNHQRLFSSIHSFLRLKSFKENILCLKMSKKNDDSNNDMKIKTILDTSTLSSSSTSDAVQWVYTDDDEYDESLDADAEDDDDDDSTNNYDYLEELLGHDDYDRDDTISYDQKNQYEIDINKEDIIKGSNQLLLLDDDDSSNLITPDLSLSEEDIDVLHDIYVPKATSIEKSINSTIQTTTMIDPAQNTTTREQPFPAFKNLTLFMVDTSSTTVSTTNVSYFYLRDELGLSEDIMWKITNIASSVLGLKADTVREKVDILQSTIGLSDTEIKHLIKLQPTILQLSAKQTISPTLLFLQRQLDLSKSELKTLVLGCPSIVTYSISNLHTKINKFFQSTMGYSQRECRVLLLKEPRILKVSVQTGFIPRIQFLHTELEMSIDNIRTVCMKNPKILLMSIESNLQPKLIFFMIMALHMTTNEIQRLLMKYPQILNYNYENHIRPIYSYFLSLDFSTYEISKILQRYPKIVSLSLQSMKQKISYFQNDLQMNNDMIRRIMYQSPQILSLGQRNIETTIEYLLDVVSPGSVLVTTHLNDDLGSSDDTLPDMTDETTIHESNQDDTSSSSIQIIQTIVCGLPSVLGLSIDNTLKPKIEYLIQQLGQEGMSKAIVRLPTLLGYSLQNRIRPRLDQLIQLDIPGEKITVAITLKEDSYQGWLQRRMKDVPKPNSVVMETNMTMDNVNNTLDKVQEEEMPTNSTGRVVEEGGKVIHWRRGR